LSVAVGKQKRFYILQNVKSLLSDVNPFLIFFDFFEKIFPSIGQPHAQQQDIGFNSKNK